MGIEMPANLIAMMKVTAVHSDGCRTHIGYAHQDAAGFVGWDTSRAWLGKTVKSRFRSDRDVVQAMVKAARIDASSIRSIHWQADV